MTCRACSYLLAAATMMAACSPAPSPTPPGPTPPDYTSPPTSPTGIPTTPPPVAPFSPAPDAELAALVHSSNAFTADLYRKLAAGQGNLAASPASVALALAMAYAGAGGETATQMHGALRLTLDAGASHRAFGTLLRQWQPQQSQSHKLNVANRLFSSNKLALREAYKTITKDYYAAPVEALDFAGAAETSRQHINDWVGDQTRNKIQNLIPEGAIKADTQLVLANAVYFKGHWSLPFTEKKTADETFHAPGGDIEVPMMHQQRRLPYHEADGIKVLELGYQGGAMAMTFLLPNDNDGLGKLEAKLNADNLARWTKSAAAAIYKVTVALPRFKIEPSGSIALTKPLSELGMPLAFDATKADFREIAAPSGPNLYIEEIFHKAMVDVNERGTEAAAATGGVMFPTSLPPPAEPRDFIADHPFIFLIRDTKSGVVLFIGRVVKP